MAKTSFLEKKQKEYLKEEVDQATRGIRTGMRWGIFKTGILRIHLGGLDDCELTVLTDSCKLHNNSLYCLCLSHNSVCFGQMYVCIEYLWTLNWFKGLPWWLRQ